MQDRIARIEETSCTARPDHTFGSGASVRGTRPLPSCFRNGSESGRDSRLWCSVGPSHGL